MLHDLIRRNTTGNATASGGALDGTQKWSGTPNFVTVDLIAMIVSDAGLAKGEPHWGNASPLGCILIGFQPRGGWQIIQRSVQWGNDIWANCFGVKCDMNVLYQYFACTIRNRLEVWDSDAFLCPKEQHEEIPEVTPSPAAPDQVGLPEATEKIEGVQETLIEVVKSPESAQNTLRKASTVGGLGVGPSNKWKRFLVDNRRFTVRRPTKLVDGSRGGQAFMCSLLVPDDGHEYGIDDQARMQFLSVLLIAVSLIPDQNTNQWRAILQKDFQVDTGLGVVFWRLLLSLLALSVLVVMFIVSVGYALFQRNFYGPSAPYIVQLCSFSSWALGATGLLMLGGNPRVSMRAKAIPEYIKDRLYQSNSQDDSSLSRFADADANGNLTLDFGSLHGAIYEGGAGSCQTRADIVEAVLALDLRLVRTHAWYAGIIASITFMATSVVLQFAGSRVMTIGSQAMSVTLIIVTSLARGAGVSGDESWMIPRWKMRAGSSYGANLLGQMTSRV